MTATVTAPRKNALLKAGSGLKKGSCEARLTICTSLCQRHGRYPAPDGGVVTLDIFVTDVKRMFAGFSQLTLSLFRSICNQFWACLAIEMRSILFFVSNSIASGKAPGKETP